MPSNKSLKDFIENKKFSLRFNEPLAKYTTFKIGGRAKYFSEPENLDELIQIVKISRDLGVKIYFLGNGSNLLISDSGVDGVVVNLRKISQLEIRDRIVKVGAGYRLAELINVSISHNLAGLEILAGIPASVGGAIVMNAGGKFGSISNFLTSLKIVDFNGDLHTFQKAQIKFGYRETAIPKSGVIVEANFILNPMDKKEIATRFFEILREKKRTQPLEKPSAGCVFKNPPGESAGRLIEKLGLGGLRIGDVYISKKHANFIINGGNAQAKDVLKLIEIVQSKVKEKLGLKLELEIAVW